VPPPARSWERWVREQRAFLVVVAGVAAGFVYLIFQPDHWRRGTGVIAAALLVAALLRLFLRGYGAGMLAVRSRWVDTLIYLVLGAGILALDIRLHG
jgi:hypothetical protein